MEKITTVEPTDTIFSGIMTRVMRDSKLLTRFAESANHAYFDAHKKNETDEYVPMYPNDLESIDPIKLAQNTVGIAALQEGLDDSGEKFGMSQFNMLCLVASNNVTPEVKKHFSKLAHGIWYNTAIARGTQGREITKQFSLLSDEEKNDDWTQVLVASRQLLDIINE